MTPEEFIKQWRLAAKSFAEIMGDAAESAHERDRKAGHVPMRKPAQVKQDRQFDFQPVADTFPSQAMREGWGGFKDA